MTAQRISGRGVGVAVVGYGNAGRQHVAALAEAKGAYTAAVVESDPTAAANARAAGLVVRDLDDVLADESIPALALCLPPGARLAIARSATGAGKHLMLEKPPARTPGELAELCTLTTGNGLAAAVMFQHRFALPAAVRSRGPDLFAGAVASLTISRQRADSHYRQAGWRSDARDALGGVTAHLGVHYLDLACQLLGTPVTVVPFGRIDAVPGIDTQLSGHVTFESGAQLTIAVTSRSTARFEQLTVLGANDWLEIRSGAAAGTVAGQQISQSPRPAAQLRAEVYQEFAGAVSGRSPLDLAGLVRSKGVMAVLDGLLNTLVTGAAR
jgi:UDP-N-acetyl-2-amino-2-deoxyglucuronate dehydrogenase